MITIEYTVPNELEPLFIGKDPATVITGALSRSLDIDTKLTDIRSLCLEVLLRESVVVESAKSSVPQNISVEKPESFSISELTDLCGDNDDDEDDDPFLSMIKK